MRFYEFSETKIQEVIPAIAAVAGAAARGLVGTAAKGAARAAAKGLGRAAVRGLGRAAVRGLAGAAAKGIAGAAAKGIAGAGSRGSSTVSSNTRPSNTPQRTTNNPNATVGTQNQIGADEPQGQTGNVRPNTNPTKQPSLRPGSTVKLPALTTAGKPGPAKPFRISKANDKEIEIMNPLPKPGEPRKYTFKKDDLEQALSDENK